MVSNAVATVVVSTKNCLMRKLHLALVASLFVLAADAQKNEISVTAGTGLFYFTGDGVADRQPSQRTLYYENPNPNYYGDRSGMSLTIGGVFKRVTRSGFLFGLGAELQRLNARADVNAASVSPSPWSSYLQLGQVNGEAELSSKFIALMPFAGRRFKLGNTSLDLAAGPEIGFRIKSTEGISVESDANYSFEGTREVEGKKTDIRLQFQAALNINRVIVNAGYARGLTNYYGLLIGGPQKEAYSNFVRVGVGYRIK